MGEGTRIVRQAVTFGPTPEHRVPYSGSKAMRKLKKDPIRVARIHNEAIVDAYGPEERALGWYYYLENQLRFPFEARCIAARVVSPLNKGETVQVLRMAPGRCLLRRHVRLNPLARPDHGCASLPTGRSQRGPINRRSHRRLALLGSAALLLLIYEPAESSQRTD